MHLILALFQFGVLGIQIGFEGLVAGDGHLTVVVIDVADGDDIPTLLVELGIVGVKLANPLTNLDVTFIDGGAALFGLETVSINLDRLCVGILIRCRLLYLGNIVIAETIENAGGWRRFERGRLHHHRGECGGQADSQGDGIAVPQCPFCHVKDSCNP